MSDLPQINTGILTKTIILEPIALNDDRLESLKYRIEIFRWTNNDFTCQLWRRETYQMEPCYISNNDSQEKWGGETYVLETALDWEKIKGPSESHVIKMILKEIQGYFSIKIKSSNL